MFLCLRLVSPRGPGPGAGGGGGGLGSAGMMLIAGLRRLNQSQTSVQTAPKRISQLIELFCVLVLTHYVEL